MITALTILFSSSSVIKLKKKNFINFSFTCWPSMVRSQSPILSLSCCFIAEIFCQDIVFTFFKTHFHLLKHLKQCFTKLNENVIPTCVIAEIFCQPFCWILSKVLFLHLWSFIAEMFCQNIFFWHFSKVILSLTLYCWIILSTYIFSPLKILCWNILSKYILWNFTNDMFIFEDLSLKYFVKIYCLQFI